MRIVIADDVARQVQDLAEQAQAAGFEISADDLLTLPENQVEASRVLVAARLSPPPDLLLVHSTPVGGAGDATDWLLAQGLEATLSVLYSDAAPEQARATEPGIWLCRYATLAQNLEPFLGMCRSLLGSGWPGSAAPEQLSYASWDRIAAGRALELCRPLAALAMSDAAPDDRVKQLQDAKAGLRRSFESLLSIPSQHLRWAAGGAVGTAHPALSRLAAVLPKGDPCRALDAWRAALRELQGYLQDGDAAGAVQWVRALQEVLFPPRGSMS